ncbi:GNAT family N-acetyltransferase [Treponema sp. OttesenSCG-928-L16]|nr:GNAT family N-acetyltransferase [Treponema sp. OttesenSCG-928-L16]
MDCKYCSRGIDDLDLLTDLRIEFMGVLHPEYPPDHWEAVKIPVRKFLEKHLADGTYTGFTGTVDGNIVCAAMLFTYELLPLTEPEFRKTGYIINFFTRKEFRRRGYGRGLMAYIQDYARREKINFLSLKASEEGSFLYKQCGFNYRTDMMEWEP